jgi:hypothetical protein
MGDHYQVPVCSRMAVVGTCMGVLEGFACSSVFLEAVAVMKNETLHYLL